MRRKLLPQMNLMVLVSPSAQKGGKKKKFICRNVTLKENLGQIKVSLAVAETHLEDPLEKMQFPGF